MNFIISGRSYTGTTTVARLLSQSIGWDFISAGERFRSYCHEHKIGITNIPYHVQIDFDNQIKSEILERHDSVFEGRYLGLFCKDLPSIIRVLLTASFQVRTARCFTREPSIHSESDAVEFIKCRDNHEVSIAEDLYGTRDFLDPGFFDFVLTNDYVADLNSNIELLAGRLQK